MIIQIILFIFAIAAVFLTVVKPKLSYYAMIFFASWYSLFIDVGLEINIHRFIIIAFLFFLPLYLFSKKNTIKIPPTFKYLIIFIFYTLTITLIAQFYSPKSYIETFTRGEGRWIFQLIILLIYATPTLLPLLFLRKIEDIKTAATVFIGSTLILSIIGWIQSLAYYFYGIFLFPYPGKGLLGDEPKAILIDFFGKTFYRMHSLGGEPKYFATTLAAAIILLIISKIVYRKGFRFEYFLIGFFLISIFMSFSTSGIAIFIVGLGLLTSLAFFIKGLRFKFIFKSIFIISVILLISFTLLVISRVVSFEEVGSILLERTLERSPIESYDEATLKFLSNNPIYSLFGVGMGNIHLYARDYLPDWATTLPSYNAPFAPNSGYLIVGELGIFGLTLFLLAYLMPVWFNFKYVRYISDYNFRCTILTINFFAIFILISYLLRESLVIFVYIILGLLYFLNQEIRVILKRQVEKPNLRLYPNALKK